MMGFLSPELMKEAIKLFIEIFGKTPTKIFCRYSSVLNREDKNI